MEFTINTRGQKIKVSQNSFRIKENDKGYFKYHASAFLIDLLNRKDEQGEYFIKSVSRVQIGKQDIRGALSITIFDDRYCISIFGQRHFANKEELISFMVGWNTNKRGFF